MLSFNAEKNIDDKSRFICHAKQYSRCCSGRLTNRTMRRARSQSIRARAVRRLHLRRTMACMRDEARNELLAEVTSSEPGLGCRAGIVQAWLIANRLLIATRPRQSRGVGATDVD